MIFVIPKKAVGTLKKLVSDDFPLFGTTGFIAGFLAASFIGFAFIYFVCKILHQRMLS